MESISFFFLFIKVVSVFCVVVEEVHVSFNSIVSIGYVVSMFADYSISRDNLVKIKMSNYNYKLL